MKTNLIVLLVFALSVTTRFTAHAIDDDPARITFMLKNTLGYHRMFRVEGPGIAYGFTMNKRETVPCNWPVGAKLYFSRDGETTTTLILTITADDEGKTLVTGTGAGAMKSKPVAAAQTGITFRLYNPSFLPRKIALISYEPGIPGNSTNIFVMVPLGTTKFTFPVGTRLYLADREQVDVVMSGKRIDSSKPFLILKKEDSGKAFSIN